MSTSEKPPLAADGDLAQLRSMGERLGFLTVEEVQLLTDAKPQTLQSWRKRGTGPAYVLLGRRVWYPVDAVAEFMRERVRQPRAAIKASELL